MLPVRCSNYLIRVTMLTKFLLEKRILSKGHAFFSLYPLNPLLGIANSRRYSTVKLAYNEFGSDSEAPPVVIMHGLFGSKQNWRSISKALVSKANPPRKIFTLDARNHGESPHAPEHTYELLAEDVANFLNQANIKKAVVIGHSMGGRTMMYLALKYPHMVDRAVIVDICPVNTSVNLERMGLLFGAMKSIQVSPTLNMSDGRKQVKEHLSKSIPDPATVDFLLLNLRKQDDGRFYWVANVDVLEKNFSDTSSFRLDQLQSPKFDGPVLFIAGRRSDFLRESDFPKVKQIFPNAELTWLDTGHLVQLEKPAEFISEVLNFINH